MKRELILSAVVQRREKRNALNVVPMIVRDKDVSGNWPVAKFLLQTVAQIAKARTTIKDKGLLIYAHFHARSITPVAKIFSLRSRRRTAHAPESDAHVLSHLVCRDGIRQFARWFAQALQSMQAHSYSELRPQGDARHGLHRMAGHKAETEFLSKGGEHKNRFQGGKRCANAPARPATKRKVGITRKALS